MNQGDWISAQTCVFGIGYPTLWSTKLRRKVVVGSIESACKKQIL